MYLFYSDYLLWIIENCRLHLNDNKSKNFDITQSISENQTSPSFEISGCNNDDVKLAITPLNDSMHRFLCIYFEPAYSIRNSFNDTKEEFENLLSNISTELCLSSY